MNIARNNQNPRLNSSRRENGKSGMQQHNKDRMGSRHGPMNAEDERRDKFGSKHNQDAQGLTSAATAEVRADMKQMHAHLKHRSRTGSRK